MRDVHLLNAPMFDDTTSHGLLKILENDPGFSQRDLAKHLLISLGKVNFCLNALIEKGSLKVNNFLNSKNKLAYAYLLTQQGVDEKARISVRFLKAKMLEYQHLRLEIIELKREAEQTGLLEKAHG